MKINSAVLLTRTQFREGVFERDNYKCVICGNPGQDAHHIIERRLFPDGGYYLDNGATVCGYDHMRCESTELTCEQVREAAGITRVVLPPQLDADNVYDKWGNLILPDGRVSPGELFYDESVQKVMREVEAVRYSKYPRTPHLPWSESSTKADIATPVDYFIGREVVVTEKLDGENTNMYNDHIHARSIDSSGHESRAWVKKIHASISWSIPSTMRISGENLYAKHSIHYYALPSYFVGFAAFDQQACLPWDDTVEWMQLLNLVPAPVLYRGPWDEKEVRKCFTGKSVYGGEQEGYVVRLTDGFHVKDWTRSIAKYVRKDHVQTVPHNWLRQQIVPNILDTAAQAMLN